MKINYCSDLHLNYISKEELPAIFKALSQPADVLVIAGDLFAKKGKRTNAAQELVNRAEEHHSTDAYLHALQLINDHESLIEKIYQALKGFNNPVIYVPGNHEFHGMSLLDGHEAYQNLFSENVLFLNNKSVEINDHKFVCSTMWYEPTTFKSSSDFHVHNFKKDFKKVSVDSRKYLEAEVTENSIVVTHMLPTSDCVHPMWQTAESNVVFVRDMRSLIEERKPFAWIYGHTHDPVSDHLCGTTKIVCNSRGNEDQNCIWQMKTFET